MTGPEPGNTYLGPPRPNPAPREPDVTNPVPGTTPVPGGEPASSWPQARMPQPAPGGPDLGATLPSTPVVWPNPADTQPRRTIGRGPTWRNVSLGAVTIAGIAAGALGTYAAINAINSGEGHSAPPALATSTTGSAGQGAPGCDFANSPEDAARLYGGTADRWQLIHAGTTPAWHLTPGPAVTINPDGCTMEGYIGNADGSTTSFDSGSSQLEQGGTVWDEPATNANLNHLHSQNGYPIR